MEFVAAEPGEDVFEDQLLARVRNTGLESARQAAAEELERAQSRVHNLESVLIAERLESSRASADAGRARLEFERAEKNALRQQMLFREGATPRLVYEKAQKEFESVKAEYEALRTLASRVEDRVSTVVRDLDAGRRVLQEKTEALEAAVADLEAGDVRSPVDGTLLACRAKAGDEVQPSMQDLFQIAIDISRLAVVVEPEPPVLALLEPGMEVEIRIAERPDEAIPGSVAEIDEDLVTIEFSSPGPDVKPGLTARVKIKLR